MGARLRDLRQDAGIKPAPMARAFGVSEAAISKVECGHRGLSPQVLGVYCDLFDVSPLDLFRDVAEQYREQCDPFRPGVYRAVRGEVRVLDGLALYADLPEWYLPASALRVGVEALNEA